MQFSTRLPIATHILLVIAEYSPHEKITSTVLAESINVNPVVVRKVLGQLKKAGLVHVEAGIGGATLAREPAEITLWDVFCAVEDNDALFHLHENPNPKCPVGRNIHALLNEELEAAKEAMALRLDAATLQALQASLNTPSQTPNRQ